MELPKMMRRRLPLPFLLLAALAVGSFAQAAEKRAWPEILKVAEGQAVYWNAWGGDARVNAYIAWVGDQVKERYRITLHHVKLADTADAVSRVVAERAAGTEHGGSIDLLRTAERRVGKECVS